MKKFTATLACLLLFAFFATAHAAKPVKQKGPVVLTLGKAVALADYGGNKIYLVDKEGKKTWEYDAQRPQDIWVLKNGDILFSYKEGAMQVNRDKEVVWKYDTGKGTEVHACQPLPGGKILVAVSGPAEIREVDKDGKVTKTVKWEPQNKTNPHAQNRYIRKTKAGTYLISSFAQKKAKELDADGKLIREIDQPRVHGILRLPNGNTLCSIGDAHLLREFDKDGKIVWELTENDLPGIPIRYAAGIQVLPNGNILLCNWGGHGHVGEQAQVVEITRDKKVAGQIYDFSQFNTIAGAYVIDENADPSDFSVIR